MINQLYYILCTACNAEAPDSEETAHDTIKAAIANGWSRRRVANGSIWEICPKCRPAYEKYVEVPLYTPPEAATSTPTQISAMATALQFVEGTHNFTNEEIVETAQMAIAEIETIKREAQEEINGSN